MGWFNSLPLPPTRACQERPSTQRQPRRPSAYPGQLDLLLVLSPLRSQGDGFSNSCLESSLTPTDQDPKISPLPGLHQIQRRRPLASASVVATSRGVLASAQFPTKPSFSAPQDAGIQTRSAEYAKIPGTPRTMKPKHRDDRLKKAREYPRQSRRGPIEAAQGSCSIRSFRPSIHAQRGASSPGGSGSVIGVCPADLGLAPSPIANSPGVCHK